MPWLVAGGLYQSLVDLNIILIIMFCMEFFPDL